MGLNRRRVKLAPPRSLDRSRSRPPFEGMRAPVRLLTLLALSASACGSPATSTEPIHTADGSFVLARYEGFRLPVDLGPLPPAPHTGYDGGCRIELRGGSLEVHSRETRFHLTTNGYNSCTDHRITGVDDWGQVTQTGSTVHFQFGAGEYTYVFAGEFKAGILTLAYNGKKFEFR